MGRPTVADLLERVALLEEKQSDAVQLGTISTSLRELDAKIERLMQMACPVCGPKITDENHPEVKREVRAVAASLNGRNGHSPDHT